MHFGVESADHKQRNLLDILFPLLVISILFISGCAGIGIPVIGASYTPSEDKIGIPDYLIVRQNGVYRGGQPTHKGFDKLNQIHVKTIVKLNSNQLEQEQCAADNNKINLVLTIIEPDGNPFDLWDMPDQTQIDRAMKTIMNEKNWPIYIHCKNGWDRTGLIVAMFRVCHDNYSKDDAYNEMIMNGFSTSHRVIWLRGIQPYWDQFEIKHCEKWHPITEQ